MASFAPIDGMVDIGPKYRGFFVFPHAYEIPGRRFTAGYVVLKPDGLNSFRAILQGKLEGDFVDKASAIVAALKAGEHSIERTLGAEQGGPANSNF